MKKNKKLAIYPGTFDPITYGHLDILTKATAVFDEVILAISENSSKITKFSLEERVRLVNGVLEDLRKRPGNKVFPHRLRCPVRVETFRGLLVDFAKEKKATALIRGLRAVSDFEYEFQMALMNRHQFPQIETVFLMPDEKYVYLSSSIVKEVARLKGNLNSFLPKPVLEAIKAKFQL